MNDRSYWPNENDFGHVLVIMGKLSNGDAQSTFEYLVKQLIKMRKLNSRNISDFSKLLLLLCQKDPVKKEFISTQFAQSGGVVYVPSISSFTTTTSNFIVMQPILPN